jgi:hypothetical protein
MKTRDVISYRVTPESQPHLWRFIQDTAARLEVPAPGVVELYPIPDTELTGDRLLLGLPYVIGLDAAELADVIGQELISGQARTGWVVNRLAADTVASALLHSAHIALGFERFVLQYVGPLAAAGYYPADLWEGWGWLAKAERVASAAPVPVNKDGMWSRPIPLRPLGIAVEAGFARLLAEQFTGEVRPVTFDEVPHEVWDAGLARQAVAVRSTAALLLRQHRATAADVLGLVLDGRAAEILRVAGTESPDLEPAARVLTPLLHEALRARGYRFEHPLLQHLYVGPAWDRLDAADLVGSLDQPHALARLRYLLG